MPFLLFKGAKLLKNCDDPKKLTSQPIQINTIQAQKALPTFVKGKDYMFFGTYLYHHLCTISCFFWPNCTRKLHFKLHSKSCFIYVFFLLS